MQEQAETTDVAIGNEVAAAALLYGQSVTDFGDLPVAGDFDGQAIWLDTEKTAAVWDGAAWRKELAPGDSGEVACPAIAPFTSTMKVRAFGPLVFAYGYVARAAGSSTALTPAADIPAGYWPTDDHYFAPGQPIASANHGVRGVVTADGELQIGMETASGGGMGVATHWFRA